MAVSYPPLHGSKSRIAGQCFGIVGPAVAAFGHQQLSYALVEEACRRHAPALEQLPPVPALGITALAGIVAWRAWRRSAPTVSGGEDVTVGTDWFFGLVGLAMSGLAVTLILAQWLPTLFLHPCQP